MDLNQLYFDQQFSLIKAQDAATPARRRAHESEAERVSGQIRHQQLKLGAAAACARMARGGEQPA